jgi:hypothetical protein
LQVGDTIEDYFVTEEEDPTWGEEVYYDGHGNLSGDPARSFYVDGKVERIQALVKVEKSPEELLIDTPNTESPLPLDLERKYSEVLNSVFANDHADGGICVAAIGFLSAPWRLYVEDTDLPLHFGSLGMVWNWDFARIETTFYAD